jgi:hypothetical protein
LAWSSEPHCFWFAVIFTKEWLRFDQRDGDQLRERAPLVMIIHAGICHGLHQAVNKRVIMLHGSPVAIWSMSSMMGKSTHLHVVVRILLKLIDPVPELLDVLSLAINHLGVAVMCFTKKFNLLAHGYLSVSNSPQGLGILGY